MTATHHHRFRRFAGSVLILLLAFALAGPCLAQSAAAAYEAMGIETKDVLSGTSLSARVIPGDEKQFVCVTTYFTGKTDKKDAVNVRLDIYRTQGDRLESIYSRDFGAEAGDGVGDGNLQLVDLDLDGVNEIIVSYDSFVDPLIEQRIGEVILHDGEGFRTAWTGPLQYDATRAARDLPVERRDRFSRELDLGATLKTRGVTLFMKKRVIAVAGERLAEPKVVKETFPLRPRQL